MPINDQYKFNVPPLLQEESTTAAAPTGYGMLYVKTDNHIYFKDDLGNEYDLLAFLVGGPGSFLTLDDTPDSYTGHANQLTFITDDEDSLIFTKGLTWNGLVDSALLIVNDDINSGFAHMSNDGSQYAAFNYRNIGLTDGVHALNIFPNSIDPPNIRWWGGESYMNWKLGATIDEEDGPVMWEWMPTLGPAGSVLADVAGDGHIAFTPISSILSATAQQVQFGGATGGIEGDPKYLFDKTDYTFSIGSTNPDNINFDLRDLTGRAEFYMTGYGAESLQKLRYANGSDASPTAVTIGDPIGVYGYTGYDGTAWGSDVSAGMKALATENWAVGAHGTKLVWAVTASGSTTLTKQMSLDATGLNIGAFGTHSYMLDVVGDANVTGAYRVGGVLLKDLSETLTNKTLTSPVLTTPNLGTPTALTLTNATGLPTAGLVNNSVTYAKLQQGAAHTMLVNNTASTANFAETPFEYHNAQTYAGTYTMVSGTTAPSGSTNHRYTWQRVGNVVTLQVWVIFGTNGSAVTTASISLPADCPLPAEPAGLTGGSDRLYAGTGWMESSSTSSPGAARVFMRRNAGDTAYEIVVIAGSNNGNYMHVNITYYAQ